MAETTLSKFDQSRILNLLPKGTIDPGTFISVALQARETNPNLLKCTDESIVKCMMAAASFGLSLNPTLGMSYMVPFNNKHTGKSEAQFMIGYRGLITLALRSGKVRKISSHVVYENDFFDLTFGTKEEIKHRPAESVGKVRGKPLASYAVATLEDGDTVFDVMYREDIMKVRERSRAKDSGPWVTDEMEMWRKCPVRRLAKYLPLIPEFAQAAANDEHADLIEGEFRVSPPDEQKLPPAGRTKVLSPKPAPVVPAVDEAEQGTGPHQEQTDDPNRGSLDDGEGLTEPEEMVRYLAAAAKCPDTKIVRILSSFVNQEGEVVVGKQELTKLTDRARQVTERKVRQLYKEWWELPAETRGQVWLEKRAREIAGIGE